MIYVNYSIRSGPKILQLVFLKIYSRQQTVSSPKIILDEPQNLANSSDEPESLATLQACHTPIPSNLKLIEQLNLNVTLHHKQHTHRNLHYFTSNIQWSLTAMLNDWCLLQRTNHKLVQKMNLNQFRSVRISISHYNQNICLHKCYSTSSGSHTRHKPFFSQQLLTKSC